MSTNPLVRYLAVSLFVCSVLAGAVGVKKRRQEPAPERDMVEPVGRVTLPSGNFRLLSVQKQDSKRFVYLQDAQTGALAVVETTNVAEPKLVRTVLIPKSEPGGLMEKVPGNILLVTTMQTQAGSGVQSISIVDSSDPANPKVTQTFENVTSVLQEPSRSLTYLTMEQGLWILKARSAADAEREKRYAQEVFYNH